MPLADDDKILGIILDCSLTMDYHTKAVSKSCFYHICSFHQIRSSLDDNTALAVAAALVSSCIDYANSILFGCPLKYRSWLQRLQNALARITLSQNTSFPLKSTTALLRHSNWLTTDSHITSKLSTITFKALGSGWPPYLASLLINNSPPRTMCSSSAKLLTVLRHNLSLGSRAFRISAPTTWNSVPQNVRECSLLVLTTTSKHTISVLPPLPSDT